MNHTPPSPSKSLFQKFKNQSLQGQIFFASAVISILFLLVTSFYAYYHVLVNRSPV